jgi:hypothetical protein
MNAVKKTKQAKDTIYALLPIRSMKYPKIGLKIADMKNGIPYKAEASYEGKLYFV